MKDKKSLIKVARFFVVIGAILMIVLGFLSVAGRTLNLTFYPVASLTAMGYVFTSLVGGIIALVLSPKLETLHWTLVLIVIGIIGGGIGGFLVMIGGVTALITKLT